MIYFTLFFTFFKIGLFTFGGGLAMLPLIQQELLRRNWMTVPEFLDLVSIAQITPGAIGVNSATYVGNKLCGFWGGVIATAGVITPSIIIILILSAILIKLKGNVYKDAFFFGIKPITVGLIGYAGYTIARDTYFIKHKISITPILISILAFVILRKYKTNPVYVIFLSAMTGMIFL
ncbi:chromate transporter [uncultured Ilyobacter sp.]|uniref:chromate transporter n=1 Tax=uncultured Ilyobacter sp. TaxID=544433 RepID=UPI0029C0B60B|nr:chromate transporter [uncultured Ilyobacter sp.]